MPMISKVLDTNVFVALEDQNDSTHKSNRTFITAKSK